MRTSKLLHIIKSLSLKELKRFETYLLSPFFNTNPLLVQLFGYIKDAYPDFEDANLIKEKVYPKIYPNSSYESEKLRLLMSALTKQLEGFLIYTENEKKEIAQDLTLLDTYTDRNLDKYFWQHLKYTQQKLNKEALHDANFFKHQYLLQEHAYQFSIYSKSYPVQTSLQEVVDNFDTYYLAHKLRYSCAVLTRGNVLSVQHQTFMLEEIIAGVKDSGFLNIPVVAAYYYLILLLLHNTESDFRQLQKLLSENRTNFPALDLRTLYTGMVNFCAQKIKEGNMDYYQYLFDVYQEMLDTQIIYVGDYISPSHYRNIISLALKIKPADWTKKFIHEYKDKLHPNFRKNVFNYSLATLYFSLKNYDKALTYLLHVEFTNAFSHISYKKILLQTYFELNETEALESLVGNFRGLLKRNKKISVNNASAYRNFVNYTMKLYRVKHHHNRAYAYRLKVLLKIKMAIEVSTSVIEKKWLLEKVGEMEGVYGGVD